MLRPANALLDRQQRNQLIASCCGITSSSRPPGKAVPGGQRVRMFRAGHALSISDEGSELISSLGLVTGSPMQRILRAGEIGSMITEMPECVRRRTQVLRRRPQWLGWQTSFCGYS
jgi:hypothetical protein